MRSWPTSIHHIILQLNQRYFRKGFLVINTPTALQVLKKEIDELLDRTNNYDLCDTIDGMVKTTHDDISDLAYLLGRVIDEVEKIGRAQYVDPTPERDNPYEGQS